MIFCTYPLLRQRPLRVPALRRATLKSAKWPNAFCPNPSVPRCGSACPHHRPCYVGPPRSAIPGRVAANPASCRVTLCAKPAFGQRGLTGPLRSRSTDREQARSYSVIWSYAIVCFTAVVLLWAWSCRCRGCAVCRRPPGRLQAVAVWPR